MLKDVSGYDVHLMQWNVLLFQLVHGAHSARQGNARKPVIGGWGVILDVTSTWTVIEAHGHRTMPDISGTEVSKAHASTHYLNPLECYHRE